MAIIYISRRRKEKNYQITSELAKEYRANVFSGLQRNDDNFSNDVLNAKSNDILNAKSNDILNAKSSDILNAKSSDMLNSKRSTNVLLDNESARSSARIELEEDAVLPNIPNHSKSKATKHLSYVRPPSSSDDPDI